MITDFLLPGMSIGLNAVTIPGPMTAYVINVALRAGWRRALLVVFSPLITDPPIILLVVLLLNQLQAILPGAVRVIQLLGGLLLLWIAFNAWKQYRAGVTFGAANPDKPVSDDDLRPRRVLAMGILMNLLSPGLYIFWTTVNGPLLIRALSISWLHAAAFLIGFYGVFMSGLAIIGFVFARAGSINPRVSRWLTLGTIALIVFFGARFIVLAALG